MRKATQPAQTGPTPTSPAPHPGVFPLSLGPHRDKGCGHPHEAAPAESTSLGAQQPLPLRGKLALHGNTKKVTHGVWGRGWAQRFIISLGPAQTLSTPSACRKTFLISTAPFCQPREREREQGQRKVVGWGVGSTQKMGIQASGTQVSERAASGGRREARGDWKRNRRGLTLAHCSLFLVQKRREEAK